MREITFSNYHVTDETQQLEKLLVDILTVIENSLFWDIIFSDINWREEKKNTSGKDFNYIKVSNKYDGVFIELNFEVNNKFHDFEKYINEYEIEIESKFKERKNNIMMLADERMMYSDIDKTVRKKFEKLENSLQIDFEVLLESSKSKINFGNLLRRKQDLDYTYLCYAGGAYEIYRYDKYNNCIKIIYSFDQNSKQLASTIKYIVPYNEYAYGIRMPVINQYICKENIERYIMFSKNIADKLVKLYEKSVNDKINIVPDYLDLKYQTALIII
ncbi:MAG: hypothetical protein HDT39_07385 [Lachnospiraceae bacterium]|nr:hypothetical protein [Lachnospiraceae bacterium]